MCYTVPIIKYYFYKNEKERKCFYKEKVIFFSKSGLRVERDEAKVTFQQ